MVKLARWILLIHLCSFALTLHAAGVVMGATRVIYDENLADEATITIRNKDQYELFLVQSWIDDEKGNRKTPFVVTPPLFRLDPNKENMLRIIKTTVGQLPKDRESVYWLNVKAIPPSANPNENTLQIAIKTRMKLFYRPKGLSGEPLEAAAKLKWKISGNQLIVTNNMPFSVTLSSVTLANQSVAKVDLVLPFSQQHYRLTAKQQSARQLNYTIINDFGGVSKPYQVTVS